ncbi:uncharacterized protein CTRU02_208347 [Colletotrichum truncatum]|uniref:Uncharacterized protein n=1 Tax=Colletotrichum truncatum TaxID=5467 RepID=A0ACC3YW80_COLTU|nr:uncharacterized protein CTRU02_07469 [Colletotrichum truncatum]KAF6791129.1 hypothetical protein CTRU02_07469 [Colletotrichum truncatum]
MTPSRKKASSLLSILLFATPIFAKFQNDFSLYPSAAQPCLYSASDSSQCDGETVPEMNKCLCSDSKGQFVTSTAKCLGKSAKDTVPAVYKSLSTSCSDSQTPLSITEDQFVKLADSAATTTTIRPTTSSSTSTSKSLTPTTFMTTTVGGATVTVTATPTPTESAAADESSGLGTTAKIGIGVGIAVGAVGLAGIAAFLWRMKRNRGVQEESRPMLGGGVGPTGYNPQNSPPGSAAAFGVYTHHEYKTDSKDPIWRPGTAITTSPSPGGQTWATASPQPSYSLSQGPYAPPPQEQQQHAWGHHPQAAYAPAQADSQPGVFELASMPVQASHIPPPPNVVEMPATEVTPQPARYQYPSQR